MSESKCHCMFLYFVMHSKTNVHLKTVKSKLNAGSEI